jgi:hypothetical protein
MAGVFVVWNLIGIFQGWSWSGIVFFVVVTYFDKLMVVDFAIL